ncbi:hypothetical protein NMG60_11028853 [Bertholletia excelsa]
MGNCVFKGFGGAEDMIRVMTSNGGIMELYSTVTAECITNEFPGHALFRSRDFFSQPLLHSDELQMGEFYYLLPIISLAKSPLGPGHNTGSTASLVNSSMITPYRMSFDNAEVLPRYNRTGVWKVKLVISPEQLSEILSQEARTEALIESVRTVAKCGSGGASSVANSDQWSVSSATWKASPDKSESDIYA